MATFPQHCSSLISFTNTETIRGLPNLGDLEKSFENLEIFGDKFRKIFKFCKILELISDQLIIIDKRQLALKLVGFPYYFA